MNDRLLIVGAGGHAKEVMDAAEDGWVEIAGFFDENAETPYELGILTVSGDLDSFDFSHVVVAIGDNATRKRLTERFSDCLAPPLIHPSAVVSPRAQIADGTMVMAGAVISSGARIGTSCIIGQLSYIAHDCVIGPYTHVATGCMINGETHVGEGVVVGSGTVTRQRTVIEDGAICGAGSVIVGTVEANTTVAGVPARLL